jgi:cell wall-associated NlpC family hydrolase
MAQSFTSIQVSIKPALAAPIRTLRRLPSRYLLHAIVALVVPISLGLSQLPIRPQAEQVAPGAIMADSPHSLEPLDLNAPLQDSADGVIIGDPPIQESEAIPVPLSLTSRSEALAPVVVSASILPDVTAKIRNGPGLAYDEIGRLDSNANIELIGRYGEWLLVHDAQRDADYWVAAELVNVPQATMHTLFEVQEDKIPPPPPPKIATVREANLNLRDGPGTAYVSMTKLEAGKPLALVEQYQDWVHVAYDDVDGWVHVDYLDMGDNIINRVPVTETIPDPNPPLVGSIIDNMVNLRKGPGTAYDRVDQLDASAEVALLARHDDWFKVQTGYGQQAWIFSDLLDIAPMARRRVPYTNDIPALPRAVPQTIARSSSSTSSTSSNNPAPASRAAAPAAPIHVPASGDVASYALQFVGYRYIYGGSSPSGFDCSGLMTYVYRQYGVHLPHNAAAQFSTAYGARVGSINNLAPGDLVFFAGTAGPGISHVAMYIGGGRIVHAMSPGLGVQVSNVYSSYWLSHYAGAIRPYR